MSEMNTRSNSVVDPLDFDDLVTAFQTPETYFPARTQSHKVHDYAGVTGEEHPRELEQDTAFSPLVKRIEEYPQPALVVTETGQVVAINSPAFEAFNVDVSECIDSCGIRVAGNVSLSQEIFRQIDNSGDQKPPSFFRAARTATGQPVILAVVPHDGIGSATKSAIVFLVNGDFGGSINGFISNTYDLSRTEREIVEAFVLGRNLDEIALERKRSVQTVRKQFFSALNKCGFHSQVDLVREVVAGAMFGSLPPPARARVDHPHRKELKLLRPGGRTLDVIASGDLQGKPVFLAASFVIQRFSPKVTKLLYDAGLCLYAVSPPGYGDTSPQHSDTDRMNCFAGDVASVLDQLGLQSVPFVAAGASFLPTLKLALNLPDRMTGIQSFATIPPASFQQKTEDSGKISVVAAVGNAIIYAPTVQNLVARSSLRAWSVLGTRKMAKMHALTEPELGPHILEPNTVQAADEGFQSSIRQGFSHVYRDAEDLFSDWHSDAIACPVPITLIHGCKDKTTKIESVRDFANDLPDKVTLIEIEDGGSCLHTTHTALFIERLLAFSDAYPALKKAE